jgi:hypothetical protein
VGDSSPGSREAEGEGGEDFYMAQSGKRADLLVSPRGGGQLFDAKDAAACTTSRGRRGPEKVAA